MGEAVIEPGSFRDRTARVFYHDGQVFRGLTERALQEWEALTSTDFYRQYSGTDALVHTERVDPASVQMPEGTGQWAAVLTHERIPFVSYPYEWSFGMLRDAALLQLDLLLAALDEGLTLKDASPFNIQWKGATPVFVDVTSFQKYGQGETWVGYQQFCRMFLYPLLLLAYRDVPFQPWLRGSLEGIDAETCRNLMSPRDYLRGGVLTHVYLQARVRAAYQSTTRDVRADLRAAGFSSDLIKANAGRLRALVAGLSWRRRRSMWSEYAACPHYEARDAETKREFVRQVVHSRDWKLVWDLGCNNGSFSRIAAERADYVMALDADHLIVERLYQELKSDNRRRNVLPLVGDLSDPSPGLGWRNQERRTLRERGEPDLVLCLALIHHLVIGANIPLGEVVQWLADLGSDLVIEFVNREDPMVVALLKNKDDQYTDYTLQGFEHEMASHFRVLRREALGSGTRILYHGQPASRS